MFVFWGYDKVMEVETYILISAHACIICSAEPHSSYDFGSQAGSALLGRMPLHSNSCKKFNDDDCSTYWMENIVNSFNCEWKNEIVQGY